MGEMTVSELTADKIKLIDDAKPTNPSLSTYKIEWVEHEDPKYWHLTKKEKEANIVPVRITPKIGRNEKCPCGSNKKYKNCCLTT